MTQILFAQRSMVQAYQRCRRLRWLENYEGEAGVGLVPRRRSIHLVIGSAVHAGMEVLLREGQAAIDDLGNIPINEALDIVFSRPFADGMFKGLTRSRIIEGQAVDAALADLQKEMGDNGVELDPEEMTAKQQQDAQLQQVAGAFAGSSPEIDMSGLVPGQSSNTRIEQDSPIVIEFSGMESGNLNSNLLVPESMQPLPPGEYQAQVAVRYETSEEYLKQEISSLVEGMVRAWSRRRWRGILTDYIILEVEREGEWKLADLDAICKDCGARESAHQKEFFLDCKCGGTFESREIHFLSRHDALLLERSTGYLYLQSFKTTGTWDRRKEMDVQVDMQGLSEAVDVERRFNEAHQLLSFMARVEAAVKRNEVIDPVANLASNPEYLDSQQRVRELVSDRVAEWLRGQADSPQILGVRYEYLLKGSRRKDKKDAINPDRWVQDSVLCRAYKQEGITSDDRRWAWTYDWQDETGKGRRLDYRSWQKAAVWKTMPIADWIDLLDQGKVQEGALNEQGEALDALGEQFVPVLTVYRNGDEMLDLLEQMESQEVLIARDVQAVREAEQREGYVGKRTKLNQLFPQTRTACSYPGVCQYRTTPSQAGFCFGAADPFHDAVVLDRFVQRVPNHPKENQTLTQISLANSEIAE